MAGAEYTPGGPRARTADARYNGPHGRTETSAAGSAETGERPEGPDLPAARLEPMGAGAGAALVHLVGIHRAGGLRLPLRPQRQLQDRRRGAVLQLLSFRPRPGG